MYVPADKFHPNAKWLLCGRVAPTGSHPGPSAAELRLGHAVEQPTRGLPREDLSSGEESGEDTGTETGPKSELLPFQRRPNFLVATPPPKLILGGVRTEHCSVSSVTLTCGANRGHILVLFLSLASRLVLLAFTLRL